MIYCSIGDMKLILKILTFIALWTLVVIIVIYVDPVLIRDTGIPGLYLPMIVPLWIALVYTLSWIVGIGWVATLVGTVVTTILAIMLVL